MLKVSSIRMEPQPPKWWDLESMSIPKQQAYVSLMSMMDEFGIKGTSCCPIRCGPEGRSTAVISLARTIGFDFCGVASIYKDLLCTGISDMTVLGSMRDPISATLSEMRWPYLLSQEKCAWIALPGHLYKYFDTSFGWIIVGRYPGQGLLLTHYAEYHPL